MHSTLTASGGGNHFSPMHNKLLFPLLLLALLVITGCSPRITQDATMNFDGRYAADFAPGEVELEATYQHVWTRLGDTYIKRMYFPSTKTLTSYGEYSDDKFRTLDGAYRSYYDEGPLRAEGRYLDGDRIGTWKEYHRNGIVSQVEEHTPGNPVVNRTHYDEEGILSHTSRHVNGKLDGEWTTYDEDGKVTGIAIYREGTFVEYKQAPTSATEAKGFYRVVHQMPLFPGCEGIEPYDERKVCADRKMLEHIYSNIRYPSHARRYGVEGMAVVSFVIEKDGNVTSVETIRGLDYDITAEIERIAAGLPQWEPGRQHGEPVRVQFNLPVKFRLE